MRSFFVHPDIAKAETLPPGFYYSDEVFLAMKNEVFLKSWQFIGDESLVPFAQYVYPFILMDGFVSEPMVLIKAVEEDIKCLSNVCTHRGNIVVQQAGKNGKLTCSYHGRRFDLNGKFEFMPEFKKAENFPRPCDDLHEFQLAKWGKLLFANLNASYEFSEIISKINERVGFLPLNDFVFDATLSRDYLVQANWALYCDNYLEGFHVPFVHKDLNAVLDYNEYRSELYDHMILQIGYADNGVESFDLPEDHPDYGSEIAAYYYWVYPNMMFNFYPWGLSINIVKPLGKTRTKVTFLSYVYDPDKLDTGAGSLLDKVEREDEFVVESVQKGVSSHFYKAGRFSPDREKGVHYFHRMLAQAVNNLSDE